MALNLFMEKNNDCVIIQLDRPRQLRYGHKALKMIPKLLGKPLAEINDDFSQDDLEKVILAGLLHEDNSLTLGMMEEILDKAPTYGEIIEKMKEAFAAAYGKNLMGTVAENQMNGTGNSL